MAEDRFQCEAIRRAIERVLEGGVLDAATDPDIVGHIRECEACRLKYALDLALIEAIRQAPEEPYPSVACEVVRAARAKVRRVAALRWGSVVAAVCLIGVVMNSLGLGIFDLAVDVISGGGVAARPEVAAGARLIGILMTLGETMRSVILGGLLSRETLAYLPEVMAMVLGTGLLVIAMMYVMGQWLRKPREVRSWR